MKTCIIFCLFVAIVHAQPQRPYRPQRPLSPQKVRDCNTAAELLVTGMQTAIKMRPASSAVYQRTLGVSGRDYEEVKRLICSNINAQSLQEVADTIPASYEQVKGYYDQMMSYVASRGGYTGFRRFPTIRFEVGTWAKANGFTKDNTTVSNHVDLQTLTKFMREMQVKFGSTWFSALLDNPNSVTITDIRKFAKDLYESKTPSELSEKTGIEEGKCQTLINAFGWQSINPEASYNQELTNFEMIEIFGRNGLLSLE